jgi:hypothetical protein
MQRRETPVVIEDRSQLMTFVLRWCGEVTSSFLYIQVTPQLLHSIHTRTEYFVIHCSGQGQTSIGYQSGSAAPLKLSLKIRFNFIKITLLQKMIDKLIENWRMLWNGNECRKKTKLMRISRQTFPSKNYDRPKTTRQYGIF